jgi:hypothetical protein
MIVILRHAFPKQAMEMTEYGKHGKPRSRLSTLKRKTTTKYGFSSTRRNELCSGRLIPVFIPTCFSRSIPVSVRASSRVSSGPKSTLIAAKFTCPGPRTETHVTSFERDSPFSTGTIAKRIGWKPRISQRRRSPWLVPRCGRAGWAQGLYVALQPPYLRQ